MKAYISAQDVAEAREMRALITAAGHDVTSSWIDRVIVPRSVVSGRTSRTPEEKQKDCEQNLADLTAADVFVQIASQGSCPGGTHFELGYAVAIGKPAFALRCQNHMYHYCSKVKLVTSHVDVLAELANKETT